MTAFFIPTVRIKSNHLGYFCGNRLFLYWQKVYSERKMVLELAYRCGYLCEAEKSSKVLFFSPLAILDTCTISTKEKKNVFVIELGYKKKYRHNFPLVMCH